jgi:prophage antirepressor-like protein
MSNTSALVPYLFEGHRIRVSTDHQGEAWIVVADACAALAENPMVWAMAIRCEEAHCLHSEEGPGAGGFTLALINEAALLRRLLNSDNPSAPRLRRWLTHELLPALQRRQECNGELPPIRNIEAIRRQTAVEVLRGADEIIHLTGVSHAEALLSVLEEIQAQTSPTGLEGQQRVSRRAGVAWLTADELADRLDRSLRHTNQRLAAAGLQQRNEDDDWQLTEAGRDWGVALPLCSRGERRQQILWDPAVVALLHQTN